MSRASRVFVRIAFLALLLGCTAPAPPAAPPSWPTLAPTGAQYNSSVVGLRTSLGRAAIRLDMAGAEGVIRSSTCTDPGAARLQAGCVRCELAGASDPFDERTLDTVTAAFDRYPASFLVASGIAHVSLCKDIAYEDIARDCETAGTVDLTRRRLFVSLAGYLDRAYDPSRVAFAEDIVHHELFHLIDFVHSPGEYADDPEWRLHNPLGFEYRERPGTERLPGFVNTYAATNEHEDRASVFQLLMARPDELCAIAKDDPIVQKKVSVLWARIAKIDGDAFLRRRAPCVDWLP